MFSSRNEEEEQKTVFVFFGSEGMRSFMCVVGKPIFSGCDGKIEYLFTMVSKLENFPFDVRCKMTKEAIVWNSTYGKKQNDRNKTEKNNKKHLQ